jgi:glycosyltransferase involved in cell wall biosynthesis
MKLSVLVCTRNRAASLARTLQSLLAQSWNGGYEREFVVVDNGSTDGTRATVESLVARHPAWFRYVCEPRAGLSIARNTGLRQSDGEIVAFTDDDVLVAENWCDEIAREFAADPQLGILGGRILLAHEGLQPVSFKTDERRAVFRSPRDYNEVYGANTAFRRSLFEQVGVFDTRIGAGCFHAGGDEAELIYRALKAGFYVLYAPNVVVHHDHGRTTLAQVLRLEYGYGKGLSGFTMKHILRGDREAARILYWSLTGWPRRWWGDPQDSPDLQRRSRAHCHGMLAGLIAAPFVFAFGDGETSAVSVTRP